VIRDVPFCLIAVSGFEFNRFARLRATVGFRGHSIGSIGVAAVIEFLYRVVQLTSTRIPEI